MMFEQSLLVTKGRTERPVAVFMGFLVQCIILGAALLIPLFFSDALPGAPLKNIVTIPLPPVAPAPPPPPEVVRHVVEEHPQTPTSHVPFVTPRRVPTKIEIVETSPPDAPPPLSGLPGIPGGIPCGQVGLPACGSVASVPIGEFPPPPPPPAPEKPKPILNAGPVRVGGNVQQGNLVIQIKPSYPSLARSAHVQGTVRLEAVITRDGSIENLRLLGGPPLLVQAAMQAVAQWRYRPTLLNGQPVEVITTIDVNFTLAQ